MNLNFRRWESIFFTFLYCCSLLKLRIQEQLFCSFKNKIPVYCNVSKEWLRLCVTNDEENKWGWQLGARKGNKSCDDVKTTTFHYMWGRHSKWRQNSLFNFGFEILIIFFFVFELLYPLLKETWNLCPSAADFFRRWNVFLLLARWAMLWLVLDTRELVPFPFLFSVELIANFRIKHYRSRQNLRYFQSFDRSLSETQRQVSFKPQLDHQILVHLKDIR